MSLVFASLLLVAGLLFLRLLYVVSRRQVIPGWASDDLVASIWLPVDMALIAFGGGWLFHLAQNASEQAFGAGHLAGAVAVLGAGLLAWRTMRVPVEPPVASAQVHVLFPDTASGDGGPAGSGQGAGNAPASRGRRPDRAA